MAIYDLEEQEKLDALKAWWTDNRRTVILAVIAFAVTVAAVQGWRHYKQTRALGAAALYEGLLEGAKSKDPSKVQAAAASIIKDYASSGYAAPAAFTAAKASVDAYGAVCWPNGADLAPDALYEILRGKTRVA